MWERLAAKADESGQTDVQAVFSNASLEYFDDFEGFMQGARRSSMTGASVSPVRTKATIPAGICAEVSIRMPAMYRHLEPTEFCARSWKGSCRAMPGSLRVSVSEFVCDVLGDKAWLCSLVLECNIGRPDS